MSVNEEQKLKEYVESDIHKIEAEAAKEETERMERLRLRVAKQQEEEESDAQFAPPPLSSGVMVAAPYDLGHRVLPPGPLRSMELNHVFAFMNAWPTYLSEIEVVKKGGRFTLEPESIRSRCDQKVLFGVALRLGVDTSRLDLVTDEHIRGVLSNILRSVNPADFKAETMAKQYRKEFPYDPRLDIDTRFIDCFWFMNQYQQLHGTPEFWATEEHQKQRLSLMLEKIAKCQPTLAQAIRADVFADKESKKALSNLSLLNAVCVKRAKECEFWTTALQEETATLNKNEKEKNKKPSKYLAWGSGAGAGAGRPSDHGGAASPPSRGRRDHISDDLDGPKRGYKREGNKIVEEGGDREDERPMSTKYYDEHPIPPSGVNCLRCNKPGHWVTACQDPTPISPEEAQTFLRKRRDLAAVKRLKNKQEGIAKKQGGMMLIFCMSNNMQFAYRLDSGTDQSCVSLSILRQATLNEEHFVKLPETVTLWLADHQTEIHANHTAKLGIQIETIVGSVIIRNIPFLIIDELLPEILIGLDVQESLGISPLQNLTRLQNENINEIDVDLDEALDLISSDDDVDEEEDPLD